MLWPILLVAGLIASWSGIATAQESESDSLATAFFLLKFDYDMEKANHLATAKLDSLRYAQMEKYWTMRVDEEISMRNKSYLLIGAAFLLAGLAIYAGAQIE